jgi:hypothetical protein
MAKKALKKHPFGGAIGKFLTGPLGGAVPQLIGKMMGPKKPKPNTMQAPAGVQPVNMSGMQQPDSEMMMKKGGMIKPKTSVAKKKMGGSVKKAQGGYKVGPDDASKRVPIDKQKLIELSREVIRPRGPVLQKMPDFGNNKGELKKMPYKPSKDDGRSKYQPLKKGGMIKRADGSMSKRGLWDNIRANKGSGKAPTAAMLKQEKKIKAQTKKK